MQPQEIFETVSKHLFNQGERAVKFDKEQKFYTCMYRGKNGTKCAVGVLIPDSMYHPKMERAIDNLIKDYKRSQEGYIDIEWSIPPYFVNNYELLVTLQDIVHDDTENWKSSAAMRNILREVAKDYGLEADFLKDLHFSFDS